LTEEALGSDPQENLAIASCGNAALGAAVIAAAMKRNLEVFVPVWADEAVIARLDQLGASINRCERQPGESGDPCYHRFSEAVAAGAGPFSVQGTDTPSTFDGGRTLGWELADQVPNLDSIYIQVGGGALATAVSMALPNVRLHPVQAEGAAPLRRAWDAMSPDFDFDAAQAHPDEYMTPWENPTSLATGILDDITYDWIPLLKQTRATGGEPIVVPEDLIVKAYEMAHQHTDVPVCATGTAGLAGLLHQPPDHRERVAVLFTGLDRR
jgi:threonine synthase